MQISYHGNQSPLILTTICGPIFTQVERFRMLRLEMESDCFQYLQHFFANSTKRAPRLKELDIRLTGNIPDTLPRQSMFPGGLPRLNSLHVHEFCSLNLLLPQCPVANLKIQHYYYYHSSIVSANRSFAYLTHLTISAMYKSRGWAVQQIEFPRLKGLYMR